VWTAADLLTAFCDAAADWCVRASGARDSAASRPGRRRAAWPRAWLAALTGRDPIVELADETVVEDLARWAAPMVRGGDGPQAVLCVQLATPAVEEASDDPHVPWPLTYHLQPADDPSLLVAAEQVWASGASLRLPGRRLVDPQESLARGLAEA